MKRSLVLVAVVAIACSRHPLENEDGGNAGTGGGAIAGVAGTGGRAAGSGAVGGASGGDSGGGGTSGGGGAGGLAGSTAGRGGAGGESRLPLGARCTLAATCASGFCVDGVCCNTACAGSCVSCSLAAAPGQCVAVPSGTPDPRGVCATETCSDGAHSPSRLCDGAGMCLPAAYFSCAPYRCQAGGSRCAGSCTADPDCTIGVCRNGSCQRLPQGAPCSDNNVCATGICAQGVCCLTVCSGPCRSCALPGTTGLCLPVPAPDPTWNCPP